MSEPAVLCIWKSLLWYLLVFISGVRSLGLHTVFSSYHTACVGWFCVYAFSFFLATDVLWRCSLEVEMSVVSSVLNGMEILCVCVFVLPLTCCPCASDVPWRCCWGMAACCCGRQQTTWPSACLPPGKHVTRLICCWCKQFLFPLICTCIIPILSINKKQITSFSLTAAVDWCSITSLFLHLFLSLVAEQCQTVKWWDLKWGEAHVWCVMLR